MLKRVKLLILAICICLSLYGLGRLYYRVTDGFSVNNITSELSFDPSRDTRPLLPHERDLVDSILSQKFSYLGKGCQSYVFLSADGNYVLKFFKYQRYKNQPWFDYLSFIPAIDNYRLKKLEKKQKKLNSFFQSWRFAFDELQESTGLVYVHLNKTYDLNKTVSFYDKMGFEHKIDMDQMEFLIQRKAQMLCPYLHQLTQKGQTKEAKQLLTKIIALILQEYRMGIADNDHALMQNTGVLDGKPIHIDIGQIVKSQEAQEPEIYIQELFSKTYKFRRWLKRENPELLTYFEGQLKKVIGPQFAYLQPHFKSHDL